MYMYYVLYFSLQKHKSRYMNCPIFWQCLWHTRSSTLSNFLSLFVTYQDNPMIQFSDNVCDKSGKLCHCIIPVSDNVRDISGQLPSQIFWQCVWHIRKTVSLYHPIFWQCLWHIRPTTLSKVVMEKKESGKSRKTSFGWDGPSPSWRLICSWS